jgi:DNA-binding transcriptional LysR family regulator
MPLRWERLSYFIAVADEGQVSRAATKLNLTQSGLSRSIAALERELGVRLLERHPRGVALTPAGETFLAKARVALIAAQDAVLTAQAFARATAAAIEIGFVATPPMLKFPQLFAAFADARPGAELSFRELQFPCGSTAAWLADVDVALCFSPVADPEVRIHPLWAEPRVIVASKSHPLATSNELSVADVLDETFLGHHPKVQPAWAGFWSLDDHRGESAPRVIANRAVGPLEMIGHLCAARAITTLPASSALVIEKIASGLVTIPLRDADLAVLSLVRRSDNHNPLVQSFVAMAQRLAEVGPAASAATAPSVGPHPGGRRFEFG